jgi:catechol 2,3-dioxygenase-like lactoylglutathione lyase family enzyme
MRLEHANINVVDIEKTLAFLQLAVPELEVRGRGGDATRRWAHVGDDDSYLALAEWGEPTAGASRLNHLGLEVDGVAELRDRMLAAGFTETWNPEWHAFRSRVYITDADGLQWEFVEYHVDEPEKRNFYA